MSFQRRVWRKWVGRGVCAAGAVWACIGASAPAGAVMTPETESAALERLVLVDAAAQSTRELASLDSTRSLLSPTVGTTWSSFATLYPAATEWLAPEDPRHPVLACFPRLNPAGTEPGRYNRRRPRPPNSL